MFGDGQLVSLVPRPVATNEGSTARPSRHLVHLGLVLLTIVQACVLPGGGGAMTLSEVMIFNY